MPSPLDPLTAPSPVSFTHPRATREISLSGRRVAYEFVLGQRRTIGFMVGPDGLSVRAPRWVKQGDVDAALHDKAGWILRKLDETRGRFDRIEAARVMWQDGAEFPFLGAPVRVCLEPERLGGRASAVLEAEPAPDSNGPHHKDAGTLRLLRLSLTNGGGEQQIRDAVQGWLTRQARRLFIERLDHFAPQLGVRWTRLTLSNAATRWGSASTNGSIRLNWRLVHFQLPVIDYVVAHELSHLRVMNHSQRFWDTVATVVPDYAALRQQLKNDAIPRWT